MEIAVETLTSVIFGAAVTLFACKWQHHHVYIFKSEMLPLICFSKGGTG